MKKLSNKIPLPKQILRTRPGISLVEVIMVLGISSLMIGGALAWFDTRKSSDFYDQVRQIESRIREVQSENASSLVPGYNKDDSPGTGCNSDSRSGCVIGQGEEVFGTAVSVAVPNAGDTSTRLRILYLKRGPESGAPSQASWVQDYDRRDISLPANIKLEGFTVFGNATCTPPGAYNSWRNLPATPPAPSADVRDFNSPGNRSMLVFRRTTGGYNAFWPSWTAAPPADVSQVLTNANRPVWSNVNASSSPGWLGSYDDNSFAYQTTPSGSDATNRLQSQPCAVLWRFGSVDRNPSDATKPRFTAEINFNLVDGTTSLVTR